MRILFGVATIAACAGLSGCLVAGYSTGSGWRVWPGSLVLTALLLLGYWYLLSRTTRR